MPFFDFLFRRAPAPPVTHTVLLAERNLTIQKVFELTFNRTQFRFVSVTDGAHFAATFERERPNVIFVAVDLPTLDAFHVAAYVRSHASLGGVPIVLLHGITQRPSPDALAESHINAAFQKPFDSRELLALTSRLVSEQSVPASNTAHPTPK